MTVYEGVKLLKSCGWWDILRGGILVNPAVERYLEIYERFLQYAEGDGSVMDWQLWTADDFQVSERWVQEIRKKFSAPLPEGAIFSEDMVGVIGI